VCNPRRVRVRASRRLAEAWQAEITRTVQASGTVTGEARLFQPFAASLPGPVRARLAELLAVDPTWRQVDGGFRYTLPDGYVQYRPDTGELEIVAQVTATVTAEGTARRTRSGVGEGEADAEAEAGYYADGYGGRTKTVAEKEAGQLAGEHAERQAMEQAVREAAEQREQAERALAAEAGDVDAEAHAQALRELEEERLRQVGDLDAQAGEQIQQRYGEYLRAINVPLARAYRDVLLVRAAQADATGLYHREEGGIIEIQFELLEQ
jgi:hypothetical protein